MANTSEEIMLTLEGRDNASQMFANVDKNAQSMASNISSAMSKINTGLMSLGQVTDNVMQSLTGKSAMDNIFGTASKAETNMVLLENMLEDSEKNFDSFYETVDKTTDNSLTSMQELIPALNALNSATGATDKELQNITPSVANFGAAVLAQTGSVDRAQQAMMDLSKGYKGAYASLDQYGITEDALAREGFNEGDSIEKYMDAVTKVIGSTDKLMETNQGLDALIGKSFSRAGKKIGNEYLPVIKDIKRGFIDLDNEMGGAIASTILLGSAGVESGNRIAWNISTAVQGARDLADAFKFVSQAIKGTEEAAEAASDAINTASNISDIGAGAAGIGGAAGAGAQAVKGAGKTEKAIDAGVGAASSADVLSNLKSKNKYDIEAIKEATNSVKSSERLANELDTASEAEGKIFDLMNKKQSVQSSIDSGIFGKEMTNQLKKQVQSYNDEIDDIIGSDLWSGSKAKPALSKAQKESNSLWKYYEDLMDGQEHAMSNAEKVSSKLGFKDKGGINVFRELAESTSSSRDEAAKTLTGLGELKKSQDEIQFAMDYTQSGFLDKLRMKKDKGAKENISDAFAGIKNFFKGTDEVADVLDEAGDISRTLEGTDDIAKGMSAAAGAGEAAAAAGPAMEAGAAGGAAASAGATSLSAAFTSMIVPMLALSATIMIMIPIMAVIAAEAMIVIRLLAELMEALNFDSINLDGAVKGISSVATALAWVGVAMLALTAVNITTSIATVTSFFTGILGPLDTAVNALKQAATKLSQFSSVKVDPSVANNIKSIGDSLSAVSSAMGALTWSNITTGISNFVADFLGFSSVVDGLEQAKNDIMQASTKLNEFSGLTPLDSAVATNIQNVCDSLASVGNAMSALRSIRDGQNWDDLIGGFISGIFGEGVDIQTALENVKQDIIDASVTLAGFTGISEIPEGVADKIQKVSDTLTSVSDAFKTLRGLRDDNNWDAWMEGIFGGTDIATALETIKTDLMTASQKLAELSGLSDIEEGVTEKITKVNDALTKVGEVCTSLTGLPPMDGFDSSIITTAVTNVQTAATELAKLNETAFDGSSADTVLGSIQTTLENVKTTLASASGFTEAATGVGSQIVTGVQSGISPLNSTVTGAISSAMSSASGTAASGGSSLGTSTVNGFKSTLDLHSVMETEMGYVKTAIDNGINNAKSAAQSGAKDVVAAFKSGVNVGSPGDIARTMKGEMGYTLEAITGSYSILKNASYMAARNIVDSFGNPSLDMDMFTNGGQLTAEHIGALKTTISRPPEKTDNRPVTVIVQEGAVNVDARNHTIKEAQGLMITALEGMDHITNIDVDGV